MGLGFVRKAKITDHSSQLGQLVTKVTKLLANQLSTNEWSDLFRVHP